jgi:hypothetical protein
VHNSEVWAVRAPGMFSSTRYLVCIEGIVFDISAFARVTIIQKLVRPGGHKTFKLPLNKAPQRGEGVGQNQGGGKVGKKGKKRVR